MRFLPLFFSVDLLWTPDSDLELFSNVSGILRHFRLLKLFRMDYLLLMVKFPRGLTI
jgi:hypothetical protein